MKSPLLVLALTACMPFVSLAAADVIIDNTDGSPGFSASGSWKTRTDIGKYGTNFILEDGSTGTATYTPTLTAGVYGVEMWWPTQYAYARNARYDVQDALGSTTTYVDQAAFAGGEWFGVGIYEFAAGSGGTVSAVIHGANDGKHAVDAARFNEGLLGVTFGLSDRMPGSYSETGTGWFTASSGRVTQTAGDTVTYSQKVIHTSKLPTVSMKITALSDNGGRTSDSTYRIYDGDLNNLLYTGTLDQNITSTDLGTFAFASGQPIVEFIASGNGYLEGGEITMEVISYTPEPGTLALLALAGPALLRRRALRRP